MEFPKYIQLDFLMVLLGIATIGFSIYSMTFGIEKLNNFHRIIFGTLIMMGFYFFLLGFYEMIKNYVRDNEIRNLQAELEKERLMELLRGVSGKKKAPTKRRP